MLSKIMGCAVVMSALVVSQPAIAHSTTNVGVTVNSGPVSVTWTWVSGYWSSRGWVRAHWFHPTHGKSYRAHRHGPPPAHAHVPRARHRHHPRHYRPGRR